MSARPRIGELLISAGLLTREQLELALERQRSQGATGRRLGQLLVELGFVSEVQVTRVLSQQLSVPWVSLRHIDFSRQLLNLVPREIAEEFCVIPVYVRHERKAGDTLYLAMEDPTHDEAIRRVMVSSGMPVKAMIAAPSDIRAAIRAFYGSDEPAEPASSVSLSQPSSAVVSPPPPPLVSPSPAVARTAPSPSSPVAVSPPPPPPPPPSVTSSSTVVPPSSSSASSSPVTPAPTPPPTAAVSPSPSPDGSVVETNRTSVELETDHPSDARPQPPSHHDTVASSSSSSGDVPTPPVASPPASAPRLPLSTPPDGTPPVRRRMPRMISLTLLDGTTLQIPAQRRRSPSATAEDPSDEPIPNEERLTTRDLIAALRAVANGADPEETLGDARWETLFAALLSVLLRKQLITDWEFVQEWQKTSFRPRPRRQEP